jgi:hypothetical protein
MLQILGISLLIYLLSRLFTKSGEPRFKVSSRSDCSGEFTNFANNLGLTHNKKQALRQSKNVIQKKIREYFSGIQWGQDGNAWKANPEFFIQGSFKHGTSIRTHNDSCDIDLGVYFRGKPPVSPSTLQRHIYNALLAQTSFPVMIKSKCVRVKYAGLFHIDVPIYYYDEKTGTYFLGAGDRWIESDPKGFTAWVADQIGPNEQMVRVIKYFKAWADHTRTRKSQKMPSGVALTVWIHKFYVSDIREDIAFIKTAYKLFSHLKDVTFLNDWICVMPVKPFDSVIEKLTEVQRENFLKRLGELIKSSEGILGSEERPLAVKLWSKVFGKRFPIYVDTMPGG